MKIKCLIWLHILFATPLFPQFSWSGDTDDFTFNDNMIRLNSEAVSAEKIIFTTSDVINSATWEVTVEMQFNPSSSNYCRIYLVCDQNNPVLIRNGYFVECGSTDDDLKLYKLKNGIETILIDGANNRLNKTENVFQLKVTKSKIGVFTLYYKDESLQNFLTEGSAKDLSIERSSYFGLQCVYTSTRSKLFGFSDISISGEAYIDSVPPQIDSALIFNSRTIHAYFNEPISLNRTEIKVNDQEVPEDHISATNNKLEIKSTEKLSGYIEVQVKNIEDLYGNIFSGTIQTYYTEPKIEFAEITDSQTVTITCNYPPDLNLATTDNFTLGLDSVLLFSGSDPKTLLIKPFHSLIPDKKYNFAFVDLPLLNGDTIPAFDTILSYHIPVMFDVVISEVLADPTPALGYSSEFIELFNRSAYSIDISSWTLKINDTEFPVPDRFLTSHSFLALSDYSLRISNQIISSKFPSIPNDKCTIELYNENGQTIDYLEYKSELHQEPFKKEGGWSLERIDPNNFQADGNWCSCIRNDGGTPGQINSVDMVNEDYLPPYVNNIYPIQTNEIEIAFSEPVDISTIQNMTMSNGIKSVLSQHANIKWNIILSETLKSDKLCCIEFNEICDFNDNMINGVFNIAMPDNIETGDLIINELMIDPLENEPEYIELYNTSGKFLNSSDIRVTKRNEEGLLEPLIPICSEPFLIPPESYVVISDFALTDFGHEFPKINYEVTHMFSLPNDEGSVILTTATGFILDEVAYSETWHLASLKDTKGISLERISPEQPSFNPDNWTSAGIAPSYSSPGAINMQYREIEILNDKLFSASDEYFTPNGDGDRDVLQFMVQHETEYTVSIDVFDRNGRQVKTICNNTPGINANVFTWNGTDENGSLCEGGIYIVLFTLNSATKSERLKKVVTLSR
ncbi:lamin tail domain-containing protein [Saccharicrinis sp. FJH2]|uniref:lamin tail domain-containing protein n=1 Tax=Saccharicrinis sp. FJH65 TaxID=3344659 RepID=UPI0035F3D115